MLARVSPTEAVRTEIDESFASGRGIAEILEEVMRLSARAVLQRVLEEEVTSWLGRDWNCRVGGERAGQRNGFGDLTVKTTAGPVSLKRPKLRNTAGQNCWSPAGSYMAATGQDLMAAGTPARPPASPWCGLCSTGPQKAGEASPTPPPSPGTSPSCATDSTNPTTPTTSPSQLPHERPNTTTQTCTPHRYYTKSETRPFQTRSSYPQCRLDSASARITSIRAPSKRSADS